MTQTHADDQAHVHLLWAQRFQAQTEIDTYVLTELGLSRSMVSWSAGFSARTDVAAQWSTLTPPPHIAVDAATELPTPWNVVGGPAEALIPADATRFLEAHAMVVAEGGTWMGTVMTRAGTPWHLGVEAAVGLDGAVQFCVVIGFPPPTVREDLYLPPDA